MRDHSARPALRAWGRSTCADCGEEITEVYGDNRHWRHQPPPVSATDGRRGPRRPEWRAAQALGQRRARWASAQASLARQGKPHALVPAIPRLRLPGGITKDGDCHWCVFWGVNPGHTGEEFIA